MIDLFVLAVGCVALVGAGIGTVVAINLWIEDEDDTRNRKW